jgi:hypothetical protein
VGIAPERAELLANRAKILLQQGKMAIGFRVLAWAFHYVEDLGQPFHAVEIPSLEMVPWFALWTWPPAKDIQHETERSITNFHWAIEGYVRQRLMEGEGNPFAECLSQPASHATMNRAGITTPRELARAVARASVEAEPELGDGMVHFFGRDLTLSDRDLAKGQPQPPYAELAQRPDLSDSRAMVHHAVCTGLANGSWATRWLLRYALGG